MAEKMSPDMTWLRLTPMQERLLSLAWSATSVLLDGRRLNAAHRLASRDLLEFLGSPDGGASGRFRLTRSARSYPPVGLKRLMAYQRGCRDMTKARSALDEASHGR